MELPHDRQRAKAEHYRLFNRAIGSLYHEDLLMLEKGDTGRVKFDHTVFDRAVSEVFAKGGFTPEMLAAPAVRSLINETYNILNGALDTAIKT